MIVALEIPSSGLSATFSHADARAKATTVKCLLPFEEWEKVADRPDEGLLTTNVFLTLIAYGLSKSKVAETRSHPAKK